MKKWYKINGIQLFVEIVLIFVNEPILFVCKDKKDNRYLVENIDSYVGEYVIAKIDNNMLINMLQNRITMQKAFKNSQKIFYTKDFNKRGELNVEKVCDGSTIRPALLPKKDSYFELTNHSIEDYLAELIRESSIVENFVYDLTPSLNPRWSSLLIHYDTDEKKRKWNKWDVAV